MYRKDRIKVMVALLSLAVIALSHWFFGKEISKWVAAAGMAIWLSVIYILNRN